MRRHTAALYIAFATIAMTGCAIQPDANPRDVPEADRAVFGEIDTGDEATGSNRIYLLAPSDPDAPLRLRSVSRDVPTTPVAVLDSLFAGPNSEERDEQLDTALPSGIELISIRRVGGALTVNVVDVFGELTPDALRLAVSQIVSTTTEIDGIDSVRLQIDGTSRVWPLGNGELTDRPLTVYDYPGLVESTQPAYPAIPSPKR